MSLMVVEVVVSCATNQGIELKSLTLLADGLDDGLDVLKVSGINNPLLSHPQFGLQFIDGYMATVEDLAQLKYIFEARKLGANAETIAKAYFKDFIKVNKAEIWSKMNNELRLKLFRVSSPSDPLTLFTDVAINNIVNTIVKTY